MKRLILTIIALLGLAAPAIASATNRMPWSTAYTGLRVRPSLIALGVDGATFIAGDGSGGSYAHAMTHHSRLTWTTWSATEGRAWGMEWIDNNRPSVGGGTFHTYKANVRVWRPRSGVFTRMTIRSRHSYRFDALNDGGWYWSEPRATTAGVHNCSNSRVPLVNGHSLLAYDQSVRNVSCATAHSVIASGYLGRGGQLVYGPQMTDPPGWHSHVLVWWFSRPNAPLADLVGAVDRETSGNRAFRFTSGRQTRWRVIP